MSQPKCFSVMVGQAMAQPYHGIHSAIEKEPPSDTKTWMDPQGMMLCEKKANLQRLWTVWFHLYQFSSVAQSCLTLCDPMDCSMPGFPVHHQLPEIAQTHVHRVGDAIQPFHPLSSPSPSAFNLSQHQGIFQWVSPLHQVAKAKVLELQHQSFQWILRTNFL